MAKVNSKLQVTLPKIIANQHGIRPGDEVQWVASGEAIRIVPSGRVPVSVSRQERLRLFDRATERQQERNAVWSGKRTGGRGWTRAQIHRRHCAR